MDLTNAAIIEPVIDIITNDEAIAVNQAWAGHPGALVWSSLASFGYPAARKCNPGNPALKQTGWSLKPLAGGGGGTTAVGGPGGGCLTVKGAGYAGGAGGLVLADCNATDRAQIFTYDEATLELKQVSTGHCVDVHSGGAVPTLYSLVLLLSIFLAAHDYLQHRLIRLETPGGVCR